MPRVAWLIALAACGDNLAPPAPPDAPEATLLKFSPCNGGFECATLVVPADWSVSDGATIALPVFRAPARAPDQRIGAITFNFGGPGGGTAGAIVSRYPGEPIASPIDLTQRFDFVAIDWRGVATTSPKLTCLTSDTRARLEAQRFAPVTDNDWTGTFQLFSDVAAGCTANSSNAPLLAHQDSESAARDLDALRAGLGEDKLNLWVVSYGTRLGAMYATLFPEHVRAIVLDSPMAPVPDFEEFLSTQSASFEAEITRFFAWCAASSSAMCPFRTSDGNPASIAAAYEQLLATADTAPVAASGITLDRATINLTTTTMMYSPLYAWPALGPALAQLAGGNGSQMAVLYMSNQGSFVSDDNGFTSYQNVCAQDIPIPPSLVDPAAYRAFATQIGNASPHVGLQNTVAQGFAVSWPATNPHIHAIGPTTAPPLLITATRHDPATNYSWAGLLQTALANGSYLVTYEGDGHGNGSFDTCLGNASAAFLLDPTTAPAQTDCPEIAPRQRIGPANSFTIAPWSRFRGGAVAPR